MQLDILVFGAHPDDAELGCAGTIIKEVQNGKRVGVIDLTRGELGTRGTSEIRDSETSKATEIMGVSMRENMNFKDGFFNLPMMDWTYIIILATGCTAYAFIAAVKVMKHLTPYTVMLTTNLEPVYGIILAYLILGDSEQMQPQFYYGAILILATVIANGIFKNKRRKRPIVPNVIE